MVIGLVPLGEEERICKKLIAYYEQIYPGVGFSKKKAMLGRKEIGELYYTFSGEENEATAAEKMKMINSAIGGGYSTPMIILQKKGKSILLDGHRRARVAYKQGIPWKALIIVPGKEVKFGIESMILGKIKDLY
jgi:hypothetical protein